MNKIIFLLLFLFGFGFSQTDLFEITPKQGATRKLIKNATIYIVNTETSDSLLLSEYTGTKAGTYYRANTSFGTYKVYVNGSLIKSNQVFGATAEMLADASISDSKLSQITTANKVAGSAVQLNSTGGITNSSGLKITPDNSSIELNSNTLRQKDLGTTWAKLSSAVKDSVRAGYGGTPTFINNPGGVTIEDAGSDSLEVVNQSIGKTKIDSSFLSKLNIQKEFPFVDTTGTNFNLMNKFIYDIYLTGDLDFNSGRGVTIPIVKRNASGIWTIRIYEELTLVAMLQTGTNPEKGDTITVHSLVEQGGSGISGYIAVNWSKISSGTDWSNMFYNRLSKEVIDIRHQQSKIIADYLQDNTITEQEVKIAGKVSFNTSTYKIKTALIEDTLFVSEHGLSEHVGSTSYSSVNLGYSQLINEDIVFSRVKFGIKGDATTALVARLYKGASEFTTGLLSNYSGTLLDTVIIPAGSVQTTITDSTLQEFDFGNLLSVDSAQYLTILIKKTAGTNPSIARFTTNPNSDRNNFVFNASDAWTSAWSASSVPVYCGAPMLILNDELSKSEKTTLRTLIDDLSVLTFDPRIVLPDTVYLSASDTSEYNIYFKNVTLTTDYDELSFKVTCDSGNTYATHWAWTPASATSGSYSFAISVYDRKYNLLATGTTILKVTSNSIGAKTYLAIGNSITANGAYVGEVQRLSGTNVTGVGSVNSSGIHHEGRSGKTYSWFENDAASPFVYSGDFDFEQYQADNSIADPDFVTILLGVNDVIYSGVTLSNIDAQVAQFISYADTLISSIHSNAPSAQIGICLPTPPAFSQDAYGTNYGNGSRYYYRRKLHRFWELFNAYYSNGGDGKASYVSIVPVYLGIDTEHNFPTTLSYYNRRNTSDTYYMQTNGVHPSSSGYYQIADYIYGWIVGRQ